MTLAPVVLAELASTLGLARLQLGNPFLHVHGPDPGGLLVPSAELAECTGGAWRTASVCCGKVLAIRDFAGFPCPGLHGSSILEVAGGRLLDETKGAK